MDTLTFIKRLEKNQSSVFTTQQLAVLLETNIDTAAVKLNRLVDKKILLRVLRGRYILPSTHILAVASSIYHPSYVSLFAAFEHYGTTTQSPRIIDVVNSIRSGQLPLSLEKGRFLIRFIKVAPSLLYGYTKTSVDGTVALIAEKERAIVDSFLFPGYVPLDETAACIRSGIDSKKATDYAKRTKRQTVMKRLGCMLSAQGQECLPDDFGRLSKTYVPLDPQLPRRGKHDPQWRIIINRVIT